MVHETLMLFAHAETILAAQGWSPVARGDMQGDINGSVSHFCQFVGTRFHSPTLQVRCGAQLLLLGSEGVGKIYSQSKSWAAWKVIIRKNKPRKTTVGLENLEFGSQRAAQPDPFFLWAHRKLRSKIEMRF